MRPKIVLTSRIMKDGEYTYDYFNKDYIKIITEMGGEVVPALSVQPISTFADCDGLIICGGLDINPELYQQKAHETVKNTIDEVDMLDLKLIDLFVRMNKPILGICRGLQILNVYFKGNLHQDLPTIDENLKHHSQSENRKIVTHEVKLEPNTHLTEIIGKDKLMVNSLHHQAIDKPGLGFKVSAISDDGIIEAIEKDQILAVQWHPEALCEIEEHRRIFEDFFQRCRNNAQS